MNERHRASLRIGGSGVVFLLALLCFSQQALPQPQRLYARARARGTVRVIVSLRTPFTPEGRLSSPAAQDQRSRISRAQDRLLTRMAGRRATAKRFQSIPFVAMEVDADALGLLYADPEVEAIEEDVPVPLLEAADRWPKSPLSASGAVEDVAPPLDLAVSIALIEADLAWSRGYTGEGKVVAILDTGVQKNHPFLAGRVVSEACYSTNDAASGSISLCPGGVESTTATGSGLNCALSVEGCDHGTHVAGIAAGNGSTFSGVARQAGLISIQVFSRFDDAGLCGSPSCALSWRSDQIRGLERVYALRSTYGIAAVNMSLGGSRFFSTASCDANNAATKAAIDNLRSAGIATVIASGNDGYIDSMSAPGCISSAVSVGSSSFADGISFFSNEASFLSLYAPGENIRSSVPGNAFAFKSGTSMATPHVAGAWAVLKQRAPAASVTQILSALVSSGVPLTSTAGTWTTSRVRVNPALDVLSDTLLAVEAPLEGATVINPFLVQGWALDRASTSGAGVSSVRVWAFPTAGGPATFLGEATLGFARPDIASLYGSQFSHSGYELNVTAPLAPGSYRLEVYARSAITGTFDVTQTRTILMAGPRMAVDAPGAGSVLPWPIRVSGWAVHLAAASGTGVDVVHVWAFPSEGGQGTFLGSASLGLSRPDVAAFFGQSRFQPSGFVLDSTQILAPGSYLLRVYARSTVTGTFDNFMDRQVTVFPQTKAALDAPANGAFVTVPFTVSGWAFNTGSPGSVGVDAVRVDALPAAGGVPVFLGSADLGLHRPDVASYFSQAAFDPSGFRLEVTTALSDGSYVLRVSIRNTISGNFDTTLQSDIGIGSAPHMSLDVPSAGSTVSAPFAVAGWALDLAAPTGTGVDLVHVWAFPHDGSPGTFLGSASMGNARPDVGAFFGSARFAPSGFNLNVNSPLPPGGYRLVAYARSTITNTFNQSRSVSLTVP